MNIHRELTELVDVYRFAVLPFCLANKTTFGGLKNHIELRVGLFELARIEAENG